MANIFSLAEFKTPSYSAFPQPHEVKISHNIGDINLVDYYDMSPRDSIDIKLQQLTRFAALAAPTMHNFRIDFHAISVPYRLAMPMKVMSYMDGYESFFNLSLSDEERPSMPTHNLSSYILDDIAAYTAQNNIIGSLFDQAQYPIFVDLYRKLLSNVDVSKYASSSLYCVFQNSESPTIPVDIVYQGHSIYLDVNAYNEAEGNIDYTAGFINTPFACLMSLWKSGSIKVLDLNDWASTPTDFWSDVKDLSGFDGVLDVTAHQAEIQETALNAVGLKWNQFLDLYYSFLFGQALRGFVYALEYAGVEISQEINFLPIFAYWTAIYDWYINTNLQSTTDKATWLSTYLDLENLCPLNPGWKPFKRYWQDDYFTSAFTSTGLPDTAIPVNGTIPQLRAANSLQELKERVLYAGKRYIDQILAIFGFKDKDSRLDRSQIIGSASFNINIQDVTQTSQSSEFSELGDLAGKGLSVGSDSFVKYTAKEHEIILILMSVRPVAIYEQQVNKLLLKTSPYDFLVPQLANVGEQAISNLEIYPSLADGADVFGYTRRYAEYMFTPSHVSGEFRTSLDYWHASRQFDSLPQLNENFCQIRPADNFDRIFAVPGASEHVYTFCYFDTVISRPLSRMIHYHL